MELEKMKNLWEEMSHELEKQKKLTDKIIIKMTQDRYRNKLRNISIPETIGAFVCFAIVIFILINLGKLDTWYLMACGIFSAAFYIVVPVMSLVSINKMKRINIAENNYKQTLIDFTRSRKQFLMVQKSGIYLSFVLIIAGLPVAGKIMNNKDLFMESNVWFWYVPLGVLFLFLFARWGYGCYANITAKAEHILKEIED